MIESIRHVSTFATTSMLLFLFIYGLFLCRAKMRDGLDLYDFFMLSMVAVMPAFCVVFPNAFEKFTVFMGVKFPFTVLFGFLFITTFVLFSRLTSLQKKTEKKITAMAHELAFNNLELKNKMAGFQEEQITNGEASHDLAS